MTEMFPSGRYEDKSKIERTDSIKVGKLDSAEKYF